MTCSFVPPYLLQRIADVADDPSILAQPDPCLRTLELDARLRDQRARTGGPRTTAVSPAATGTAWQVHDAENGTELPGALVLSEGDDDPGDDPAVTEAAHGVSSSLRLAQEVYGRDSFDGAGATVVATVHYGQQYVNAFWDGTQLVFGDGDGRVFDRFTRPVDVLGHEFAHGIVEHTAGLVYQDQPGALNESMADVFAICLSHWLSGADVDDAEWLIGAELFLPGVQARALRDMEAPGTAYDDPALGKDPQVGSMADYIDTTDDNGGVHLNSGIPNRAFVLAARAVGGTSWDGAGRIWMTALAGSDVGPRTDFAGFAAATVAAAGEHADAVAGAWRKVGVEVGEAPAPEQAPAPSAEPVPAGRVQVRRSGGFLGRTESADLDLDGDDPRIAEVQQLVAGVDLSLFTSPPPPSPDRFVYTIELPGAAPVTVPEQQLTPELRQIVQTVLGPDLTP